MNYLALNPLAFQLPFAVCNFTKRQLFNYEINGTATTSQKEIEFNLLIFLFIFNQVVCRNGPLTFFIYLLVSLLYESVYGLK